MAVLDEHLGPIHSDSERIFEQYDRAGVDDLVFSQPPYIGFADAEATAKANDSLLEVINNNDRAHGLAALPVAAGGEAAANEFERALDLGYNGGAIETRSGGIAPDDREAEPILEIADRTGAPLFIHPKLHDSVGEHSLDDTYRLNAIFGREAALSKTICDLIHGDVLDSYPNLTPVVHHLGGNIASMMGRVHLHNDIGRWPGMDNMKSFAEFKRQLEDRVYVDTAGFFGYHAPVRATLEEFPASNIIFGTDSPYEPRTSEELKRFVEVVSDLTSEADTDAILGQNALDMLVNVE
jgi:predicted TIM-barrel fold metal-dependent hydrolase